MKREECVVLFKKIEDVKKKKLRKQAKVHDNPFLDAQHIQHGTGWRLLLHLMGKKFRC